MSKQKKEQKQRVSKARNRKIVIFFLLSSVVVSELLYYQNQPKKIWQNLFKTKTYEIVGEKKLDQINLSLNLKNKDQLTTNLFQLIEESEGDYGIYFYHPASAESWGYQDEKIFQGASVNKLFIMTVFLRKVEAGEFDLTDKYYLQKDDIQGYGTGEMQYQEPGTEYTYRDLLLLTGKKSDNTAAYVLHKKIGFDKMQESLKEFGLQKTNIEENTTTGKEAGEFLVRLYKGRLLEKEHKELIFTALTDTEFEQRIPQGIPRNIRVVHKIGNGARIYNDCGIVFGNRPFILCFLNQDAPKDEAVSLIQNSSQLFWNFVNQD
jgi:beta-lactamase class A